MFLVALLCRICDGLLAYRLPLPRPRQPRLGPLELRFRVAGSFSTWRRKYKITILNVERATHFHDISLFTFRLTLPVTNVFGRVRWPISVSSPALFFLLARGDDETLGASEISPD